MPKVCSTAVLCAPAYSLRRHLTYGIALLERSCNYVGRPTSALGRKRQPWEPSGAPPERRPEVYDIWGLLAPSAADETVVHARHRPRPKQTVKEPFRQPGGLLPSKVVAGVAGGSQQFHFPHVVWRCHFHRIIASATPQTLDESGLHTSLISRKGVEQIWVLPWAQSRFSGIPSLNQIPRFRCCMRDSQSDVTRTMAFQRCGLTLCLARLKQQLVGLCLRLIP